MVLRITFHKEFSHLLGGLEHFADSNSIPWNPPTIHCPDLIATAQQTSLLLFCAPLNQQYHSSQIDEVSKFDESAACPAHPGSLAAVICDADDPCSVNTAYDPESSFTMSPRSTTLPL